MLAESARSSVVSTHLAARALELGVETTKGRALLELSMKLGQRAERTAVTAYDLAQRLAEADRKAQPMAHLAWLNAGIETDEPSARADATPASAQSSAQGNDAAEQADAAAGRADASAHAPMPGAPIDFGGVGDVASNPSAAGSSGTFKPNDGEQ